MLHVPHLATETLCVSMSKTIFNRIHILCVDRERKLNEAHSHPDHSKGVKLLLQNIRDSDPPPIKSTPKNKTKDWIWIKYNISCIHNTTKVQNCNRFGWFLNWTVHMQQVKLFSALSSSGQVLRCKCRNGDSDRFVEKLSLTKLALLNLHLYRQNQQYPAGIDFICT